jgi:hypothetical protein
MIMKSILVSFVLGILGHKFTGAYIAAQLAALKARVVAYVQNLFK